MENPSRVLGVLGGRDMDAELLARWVASADWVIAADSGANRMAEIDSIPNVAIGDMDSITAEALSSAGEAIVDPSQESTDCDKLLAYALSQGITALTLACVEGDLPDHVMATLQSAAKSPIRVTMAFRRGTGHIVRPGYGFEEDLPAGRRISLLPLESCTGVTMVSVAWPLSEVDLHPTGLTSISNRSTGGLVAASLGYGTAILFVERAPTEIPIWP